MNISVLILTLNEEINMAACLQSVAWSDDIIVLDSLSCDKTTEIARRAGAKVVERKFDNWSTHQNWAVENIIFKNTWVLYIDADERCDEELRTELLSIAASSTEYSAYKIRRKDLFMGQWLRRSQLYPTWLIRFFRPEKIRYERLVNPVAKVDGSVGTVEGHIIHYPFSHGIAHWFERHNKYSSFEAQDLIREVKEDLDPKELISRDPVVRRKALKRLAYVLPGRPLLYFCYMFFIRFAFLDGVPGINYCFMRMAYEFMIDLKVKELRRKQKGMPV